MQNSLGNLQEVRCAMGQQETSGYLCISHLVYHRILFTEHPLPSWGRQEKLVCSILEAKQIKQEHMWVYMCVCACVYVCIPMCIVCTCVCTRSSCVWACMCTCVHVYACMCAHVPTCVVEMFAVVFRHYLLCSFELYEGATIPKLFENPCLVQNIWINIFI